MDALKIVEPPLLFVRDHLSGKGVTKSSRQLADLKGVFQDLESFGSMDPNTLLYEVHCHLPEQGDEKIGALNFGITHIYPGKVGREYFMTKGHFHAKDDRTEYYWGLNGEGILILMDRARKVWGEKMYPGSLHYIPGGVAHRVANTGNKMLSFAACWPSDAGHDYDEIAQNGFSARLMEIEGIPQLM